VQVTYVKSKTEYFHIPGTAPTERDVGISDGMFRYGAIASAMLLVALLGLLFTGRAGGTPTGASPTSGQVNRVAGQCGATPGRAGFGTRRP
jgi:hypothetical protein